MKGNMRKDMLAMREAHHSKGGHVNCISIMDTVLNLEEFKSAECVLLYSSKGGEVHTEGIIQSALSIGKRVALPVTKKESHALELYAIAGMDELSPGAFGILEPKSDPARRVQPEEVDLVLVPGVSFDRRGHRLGYGMGYYDLLLKRVKGRKIGLAYGMQMVERVPDEPHDVAVDMIVTENEIIRCGNSASGEGKAEKDNLASGNFKVVVLASGKGSDFQSIIDGVKTGAVPAKIVGLITDKPEAYAIQRAEGNGIPAFAIPHKDSEDLDEGVVLAGYMKIIRSKELLSRYAGRMINIHPSLLPKYPGAHAQKDAFEAGEKISGYTIHYVDESLDGGKIIKQEKVDISDCKTWEEAAAKILSREHVGLPEIVAKFARGEIAAGKK
ncbi:MAG: phosphoribosylglycinamide formyltransferase [Candidatus Micrarchaeota archaeon]|nr:phosphoribosylglycinamide formyltransferase [Candidatus Micrarchaeota archaeon]